MEEQTKFLGVSNPAWGFIVVMALLALVILAFFAIDVGPTVF